MSSLGWLDNGPRPGHRPVLAGLLVLGLLLAVTGVIVVRSAGDIYGHVGSVVGVLAGVICYVGSSLAMLLARSTGCLTRDAQQVPWSIAARTGFPVLAVISLSLGSGLPLGAVFGMVLAYCLVGLSVESWFLVRWVSP